MKIHMKSCNLIVPSIKTESEGPLDVKILQ